MSVYCLGILHFIISKLWAPAPFCLAVKVKGHGKREKEQASQRTMDTTDRSGMERMAKRHLWEADMEGMLGDDGSDTSQHALWRIYALQ